MISKMIRYSIIAYVAACQVYNPVAHVYHWIKCGSYGVCYPKHPFFMVSFAIGYPGAFVCLILLFVGGMWLICCIGNWIFAGEFKYFLND